MCSVNNRHVLHLSNKHNEAVICLLCLSNHDAVNISWLQGEAIHYLLRQGRQHGTP